MTNNTLFDEMVEAQQAKYKIEKRLIDEIEQWFDNHGIKASIRLIDYNFFRIYSNDDNMCNFDMNAFYEEFGLEVFSYKHGFQYIKKSKWSPNENPVKVFWDFEVHKGSGW